MHTSSRFEKWHLCKTCPTPILRKEERLWSDIKKMYINNGCLESVEWNGGMEHWNGILESII